MFYQVVEEKCEQGIKPRYSKNEKIDNNELLFLMNDFKEHKYEIRDELKKKYYEFYDYDLFGRKIKLYSLNLIKIK